MCRFVVVAGQSGSGKSVTLKVSVQFLTKLAAREDNFTRQESLVDAIPFLEALGAASTTANPSGSRYP